MTSEFRSRAKSGGVNRAAGSFFGAQVEQSAADSSKNTNEEGNATPLRKLVVENVPPDHKNHFIGYGRISSREFEVSG